MLREPSAYEPPDDDEAPLDAIEIALVNALADAIVRELLAEAAADEVPAAIPDEQHLSRE